MAAALVPGARRGRAPGPLLLLLACLCIATTTANAHAASAVTYSLRPKAGGPGGVLAALATAGEDAPAASPLNTYHLHVQQPSLHLEAPPADIPDGRLAGRLVARLPLKQVAAIMPVVTSQSSGMVHTLVRTVPFLKNWAVLHRYTAERNAAKPAGAPLLHARPAAAMATATALAPERLAVNMSRLIQAVVSTGTQEEVLMHKAPPSVLVLMPGHAVGAVADVVAVNVDGDAAVLTLDVVAQPCMVSDFEPHGLQTLDEHAHYHFATPAGVEVSATRFVGLLRAARFAPPELHLFAKGSASTITTMAFSPASPIYLGASTALAISWTGDSTSTIYQARFVSSDEATITCTTPVVVAPATSAGSVATYCTGKPSGAPASTSVTAALYDQFGNFVTDRAATVTVGVPPAITSTSFSVASPITIGSSFVVTVQWVQVDYAVTQVVLTPASGAVLSCPSPVAVADGATSAQVTCSSIGLGGTIINVQLNTVAPGVTVSGLTGTMTVVLPPSPSPSPAEPSPSPTEPSPSPEPEPSPSPSPSEPSPSPAEPSPSPEPEPSPAEPSPSPAEPSPSPAVPSPSPAEGTLCTRYSPPVVLNGRWPASVIGTPSGSYAQAVCNPNYNSTPPVSQCLNGVWQAPSPPACYRVCAQPPDSLLQGLGTWDELCKTTPILRRCGGTCVASATGNPTIECTAGGFRSQIGRCVVGPSCGTKPPFALVNGEWPVSCIDTSVAAGSNTCTAACRAGFSRQVPVSTCTLMGGVPTWSTPTFSRCV